MFTFIAMAYLQNTDVDSVKGQPGLIENAEQSLSGAHITTLLF